MRPYIELRHLYAVVERAQGDSAVDAQNRDYDTGFGEQFLGQWIIEGTRPPGAEPSRMIRKVGGIATDFAGEPADLTTGVGRKQATISYLSTLRDQYATAFSVDDPLNNTHFSAYSRRPMMATIAGDFVWALGSVLELVVALPTDADDFGEGAGDTPFGDLEM